MEQVNDLIVTAADTIWVYPLGLFAVLLSALLPPVPSTSLFVALGAVSAQHQVPHFPLLVAAMFLGSLLGDLVLYGVASRTDFRNWRLMRGTKRQRMLNRTEERLETYAPSALLVSRFIPLGRTSVVLVAGAGSLAASRFIPLAAMAAAAWALYSVGVGWISANWFQLPTLVTVLIAIGVSLVAGKLINVGIDAWEARRTTRASVE